MRILIASVRYLPDFAGGVETRLHAMALAAGELGHEVEVLATRRFADLPDGEFEGVPVTRLEWPHERDMLGFWAIDHFVSALRERRRPDVVWTTNAAAGLAAQRVWRGVPVMYGPGETEAFGRRARLRQAVGHWRRGGFRYAHLLWERGCVMDRMVRSAWRTAIPSRALIDFATGGRPGRWPSVRALPRGIDTNRWTPALARRNVMPDGVLRVLIACRLIACKNIEQPIEALGLCRGRPVRLSICGSGPHEPALRALVRERGLEESVRFLGNQADMASAYAEADVFVMSSHYDLFGNTVLEAMAAGCPVVIRRPDPPRVIIGSYEAVADAPGCLIYPTHDTQELADRLIELSQDAGRLAELSQAAAAWGKTQDWTRYISAYLPEERATAQEGSQRCQAT